MLKIAERTDDNNRHMQDQEREHARQRRYAEFRSRIEPIRRWWRHDAVKAALEVAYPAWLSAPQVQKICEAMEPRYATRFAMYSTVNTLSRLHTYRQVDRIGQPNYMAAAPVGPPRRGHPMVPSGAGFRYRLRREMGDVL